MINFQCTGRRGQNDTFPPLGCVRGPTLVKCPLQQLVCEILLAIRQLLSAGETCSMLSDRERSSLTVDTLTPRQICAPANVACQPTALRTSYEISRHVFAGIYFKRRCKVVHYLTV